MLLPGGYAWLTTVLLPTWQRSGPLSKWIAAAALAALVGGVWTTAASPKWGRRIGILGFVGLSLTTWLLVPEGLRSAQAQPLRSAVGAVAWGLFAVGWGGLFASQGAQGVEANSPKTALLVPRRQLPLGSWIGAWVVGAAALSLPLLAWSVVDPANASLGHVFSAAGAMAVSGVGLKVLLGAPPRGSARQGWGSLVVLVLWGGLGLCLATYGPELLGERAG